MVYKHLDTVYTKDQMFQAGKIVYIVNKEQKVKAAMIRAATIPQGTEQPEYHVVVGDVNKTPEGEIELIETERTEVTQYYDSIMDAASAAFVAKRANRNPMYYSKTGSQAEAPVVIDP